MKVRCLNDNKTFLSVRSASEYYGVPIYTINRIITKKTKTIYGKNKKYEFELLY